MKDKGHGAMKQRMHIGPAKDMTGGSASMRMSHESVRSPSNHPTMKKPPTSVKGLNPGRKNPYC